MEFHHGLIKHYGLNVIVKYGLFGLMCGLHGIEMVCNQDVDSSLYLTQCDPGDDLFFIGGVNMHEKLFIRMRTQGRVLHG